ncbi:MAG: sulfotransferase domain-containing protein [Pseudolabrys sp.]|jgi:hypothetical protein
MYLHVGFQRTSTSKHQRDLFLHHKDIAYFGKPYKPPVLLDLVYRIAGSDSSLYDLDAIRAAMIQVVEEMGGVSGRVPLISDESMLGYRCVDTPVFCRRLIDLFGDPKIIIVVRRQDELLLSWLFHEIRKPNEKPLQENLDLLVEEAHTHKSLLHHLDYGAVCRTFAECVGNENLLVIPYELFKHDPNTYARELSKFMGIDREETLERLSDGRIRNARQPENKVAYFDFKQRYLANWGKGRFGRNVDLVLSKLFLLTGVNTRHVRDIETRARAFCRERYAHSNRAFSDDFGLDLKSFGYPGL